MGRPRLLSKSRFTAGVQCHKQLWWRVHEPDAPELRPDARRQALFDQGTKVGVVARGYVPNGILIDLPPHLREARVAATMRAMAAGAPAIYEAGVIGGGAFAAIDILERTEPGWRIIEVKSSTSVKPEHVPDLAVQVFAAREQGIAVVGAEVMHLNRECRHPDLSNLFTRSDQLGSVGDYLQEVPALVRRQLEVLDGPLPDVPIGAHCQSPYECPFVSRCWPPLPEHHISTLNGVGPKKTATWEAQGVATIHDIPPDAKLNAVQVRQRRAVLENQMVIEPGLREALAVFAGDAAFLDFETINPAIPVWPGCRPFDQVPVQVSVHRRRPGMGPTHHEFLAEGPGDPREGVAQAVIDACADAEVVIAWNASFERTVLESLAVAIPRLATPLVGVASRLADPMPVVREHVYHPAFGGGFSLKAVLPALAPDLGYEDLAIRDGDTASRELQRMLLDDAAIPEEERHSLRRDLLAYCERDTWAMVAVLDRLLELSAPS